MVVVVVALVVVVVVGGGGGGGGGGEGLVGLAGLVGVGEALAPALAAAGGVVQVRLD